MSDLLVYVREGIEVHFGMFLSGKSVPGVGEYGWLDRKKWF